MIVNTHPVLKLLDESPWCAHLVGSRFVGVFDRDKSDYDFLVECKGDSEWSKLLLWFKEHGFEITLGYGSDDRLYGSNVWTRKEVGFPDVDILPVSPEEAAMRLAFFEAMKKQGDKRGGLLALCLKREKQWATLWQCLDAMKAMEPESIPDLPLSDIIKSDD